MALKPEQIAALRDACERIAEPITKWLLRDAAERIAGAGQMSSTAAYELYRANAMGRSQKALEAFLKKQLEISDREIRALFRQAAKWSRENDLDRLRGEPIPFDLGYEQMAGAAATLAEADFRNLTQTLGAIAPNGKVLPLREFYQNSMDFAFQQVFTGASDYESAMRQATAKLANKGIRTIDYESSVHTGIEAATRRNLMGGMGLMDEQITQSNHDRLGCDGWEISAHANSAPDHEPYQGKQYSDADYRRLNSSLQRRIGTLNCGHTAMPIIMGVNSPQYTEAQLEQLRKNNEAGITYQGRHYTGYEAQQKQREIERAIRAQKNRITVSGAAGDTERMQSAQTKLYRLQREYRDFSQHAGLRTQFQRAEAAGVSRAIATKGTGGLPENVVAPAAGGAGNNTVHAVARLDMDKYRCVSENMVTDEVIITDERIRHIQKRHPGDYERFCAFMPEIIRAPDYIIRDSRANTAMLLKEFTQDGGAELFRLALRLATSTDPAGYKNSVITFLRIRQKEWNRLVKNKEILYKPE